MPETWLPDAPCDVLRIRQRGRGEGPYDSDGLRIEDGAFIAHLLSALAALPLEGDEHLKPGPESRQVELEFGCGDEIWKVRIFDGKVQLANGGFRSEASERERALIVGIEALLNPEVGRILPKVVGLALALGPFTLAFQGTTFEDHAPVTVSFNKDTFEVTDPKGGIQTLTVSSGQLPPQPRAFSVGGASFTLFTFKAPSGERIYPDHFLITGSEFAT